MRKFKFLFLLILLISIMFFIIAFRSEAVDLHMTAYLFAKDGSAQRSFPVTIQGKIRDDRDHELIAYLYLDIDFPDDFCYTIPTPDTSVPAYKGTELRGGDPNNLRTCVFVYNKEANTMSSANYVINVKQGYFLAQWCEDGSYLVASADPTIPFSDVIAFFQPYCELWGVPSEEQDSP